MIVSCFLKPRFKSILITLFVTLHLSACGTEELLTAIAPEIGSAKQTDEADIDGINLAAKINGVDSGQVIEDVDPDGDNLLEVSGKLNITDSDTGEDAFIAKTIDGNYGIFNIDTTGNWDYAASNQQSVIQNLASNATLTENLTVSSVDGTTHTVKITIIGVVDSATNNNNAAVITGVDSGNVTEDIDNNNDGLLAAIGKLNITDRDAGEAAFISTTINGNYGNVYIDISGNWSYGAFNNRPAIQNLNSGATLIDKLTVSSVDGTTHNIRITIHGADEVNQPAVISGADRGSLTEDVDPNNNNLLEVSGKLNITDSDAGESAFITKTVTGKYGSLTINTTGNWNYAANNNQAVIQNLSSGTKLTDRLIINSVDDTPHTIVIKINGVDEVNKPALITGFDRAGVTEDVDPDGDNLLEIGGKLDITDRDAGEAAFIATTINGNVGSLTISSTGNWNYAANNDLATIQNLNTGATLTENLIVSSVDGTTHTVIITITGVNEANNTATISLSWVPPSTREDNQSISLADINGYNIYYGTTSGQYPNKVNINDRTATEYTFTNFPAGTHYFVVTTLDVDGRESLYSNVTTVN